MQFVVNILNLQVMKKKEKGIKIIKKGRIDFYYPLKIETTYSFEKLCNKLHEIIRRSRPLGQSPSLLALGPYESFHSSVVLIAA